MKTIVKILFGSHLYGTSTPASDRDYKGVALPTWEQLALGRLPKHKENTSTGASHSKNTAEDVDTEIYSLHEFMKLALEGQTVAMDMLHAPLHLCTSVHPVWLKIRHAREKFYSKQINSFIGYAVGQAAKYGIKGSRLNAAKDVIDWLDLQDQEAKLAVCDLDSFPMGEHVDFLKSETGITPDQFNVCGKKLQVTSKVGYCRDVVEKFYSNYGDRARKAALDQGIDWKAISHALRAAYQMRELFLTGDITFPRPEAAYLIEVKTGQRKYAEVAPVLEELIDEVRQLKDRSEFPEKPDYKFWDSFIVDTVAEFIVPEEVKTWTPSI